MVHREVGVHKRSGIVWHIKCSQIVELSSDFCDETGRLPIHIRNRKIIRIEQRVQQYRDRCLCVIFIVSTDVCNVWNTQCDTTVHSEIIDEYRTIYCSDFWTMIKTS